MPDKYDEVAFLDAILYYGAAMDDGALSRESARKKLRQELRSAFPPPAEDAQIIATNIMLDGQRAADEIWDRERRDQVEELNAQWIERFAESRVEPWREAVKQAEKDFDELGGAREPNYDWVGVRSYALICRNQLRTLLSASPAKEAEL